jgi:hypothetical protein
MLVMGLQNEYTEVVQTARDYVSLSNLVVIQESQQIAFVGGNGQPLRADMNCLFHSSRLALDKKQRSCAPKGLCSLDIYRRARRRIFALSVIRPIRGPKWPKERSPGLPWVVLPTRISPEAEGAMRYGDNRFGTFEPDRVCV